MKASTSPKKNGGGKTGEYTISYKKNRYDVRLDITAPDEWGLPKIAKVERVNGHLMAYITFSKRKKGKWVDIDPGVIKIRKRFVFKSTSRKTAPAKKPAKTKAKKSKATSVLKRVMQNSTNLLREWEGW